MGNNLEHKWKTITDKIIALNILEDKELEEFQSNIYCEAKIYEKILLNNKEIAQEALEIIFGNLEETNNIKLLEPYGNIIVKCGIAVNRIKYVIAELFDTAIIEQDKQKVKILINFVENDLKDTELTAEYKDEAWMFGLIN